VGNLAVAVTEADLRAAFEAYGTVDAVRLITDQSSGQSKGFGFVEMPTASEAQAAIAGLHGTAWQGRPLTVSAARPRPGSRPGEGPRRAGAARLTMRRVGLLTRVLAPPTSQRPRPFGSRRLFRKPETPMRTWAT
jgi:RNA recognition motif-containing protein